MGYLNKIAFPLTPALVSAYNTPENWGLIDAANSLLVLVVPPSGYKPERIKLGESGVRRGAATSMVLNPAEAYAVTIETPESRAGAIDCLLDLAALAAATPGQYTPVEVWDYHHLKDATARSLGYTVRRCYLSDISAGGGSIRGGIAATSDRFCVGGLSFRFEEV